MHGCWGCRPTVPHRSPEVGGTTGGSNMPRQHRSDHRQLSCSIHIVICGILSLTLNVNPTLYVITYNFSWGLKIYGVAIIVTHQVIFHQNQTYPWQRFVTSCWQEKVGFWANGWTHPPSMTIFVNSFVRSIYHPKSSYSDIKYHMTLNVMYSVVVFAIFFEFRNPNT